ncbi:hypothetical protein DICVIV_02561 [Dictyocaulus viviparus]|uniref:Uncharacterized protein n=1 Tax=Dictyocaulus viviparus TaxID=29172 RepID=A0A0D8Y9N7_DICVI|nr:hypothetical protein DICVIV_02561 [Dictyocaulus viviparus]
MKHKEIDQEFKIEVTSNMKVYKFVIVLHLRPRSLNKTSESILIISIFIDFYVTSCCFDIHLLKTVYVMLNTFVVKN